MACTATATRSLRKEVIKILEMTGCVEVSTSTDRPNIYYVVKLRSDIDSDFLPLVTSLREKAVHTPRVLVYCQSLLICMHIFIMSLDITPTTLQVLFRSLITDFLGCSTPAHHIIIRMSSSRVSKLLMELYVWCLLQWL